MNEPLNRLIDILRQELNQYGEMLALLDQQQNQVVQRHSPELLQTTDDINAQGVLLEGTRQQRECVQRELARAWGQPDDVTLTKLSGAAPAEYRPLLEALIKENNQLLWRVQQRARQNHLLLRRSLDLLQRFIGSLCPTAPPVYTGSGSLRGGIPTLPPLYEAIG